MRYILLIRVTPEFKVSITDLSALQYKCAVDCHDTANHAGGKMQADGWEYFKFVGKPPSDLALLGLSSPFAKGEVDDQRSDGRGCMPDITYHQMKMQADGRTGHHQ
jgi:hypothetical protein